MGTSRCQWMVPRNSASPLYMPPNIHHINRGQTNLGHSTFYTLQNWNANNELRQPNFPTAESSKTKTNTKEDCHQHPRVQTPPNGKIINDTIRLSTRVKMMNKQSTSPVISYKGRSRNMPQTIHWYNNLIHLKSQVPPRLNSNLTPKNHQKKFNQMSQCNFLSSRSWIWKLFSKCPKIHHQCEWHCMKWDIRNQQHQYKSTICVHLE